MFYMLFSSRMANDTPFSISPNPLSLHLTDSLKAVLHKSRYVIDHRQGLSCILGDVGLGKSTMLRYLWSEYGASDDHRTFLIPTPNFPSPFAMLKEICLGFGLEPKPSRNTQERLLNDFLVDEFGQGKNIILFIDEAQNLDNKQLELIRAILNFETNEEKLVQIVLAGQLELKTKLDNKRNKYLKSRIVMYSTLNALTLAETIEMVSTKCEYAEIANPFSDQAIQRIYKETAGVPRSVLKMCSLLYVLMKEYNLDEIPVDEIENIRDEVAV
jgi:general secretion pathway protein A